jgi:uncharacterized membrane protein HdeD (DUF308 family)
MKNVKSIWQEGQYYDAWMFVHFLAGVVLGFGMIILNIETFTAYTLTVVLLILWEFFEIIKNIVEHKENRVGDIIIGTLGFVFSFSISPMFIHNFIIPFVVCLVVFAVSCIIGWTRYFKYKKVE